MADVTFNVDLGNLFLAGLNSHVSPSSFSNPFVADSFASLLAGSDYPELEPNSEITFSINPSNGGRYSSRIIAVTARTTGPNPELIDNDNPNVDIIELYNNFYSSIFIVEGNPNIVEGLDGTISIKAVDNEVVLQTNNYNDNHPDGPLDYYFNYTVLFSVVDNEAPEGQEVIQYFTIDPIYRITRRTR